PKTPFRRRSEARRVEPLCNVATARRLAASAYNIRANIGDAKIGGLQGGRCARPGNLQRETFLEGGYPVDPPARNHFVPYPTQARGESLAVTKGEVEDITDHETLGNILGGKRFFSLQIVPVLDLPDTSSITFQPTRQGIGVTQQLSIGVSDQ